MDVDAQVAALNERVMIMASEIEDKDSQFDELQNKYQGLCSKSEECEKRLLSDNEKLTGTISELKDLLQATDKDSQFDELQSKYQGLCSKSEECEKRLLSDNEKLTDTISELKDLLQAKELSMVELSNERDSCTVKLQEVEGRLLDVQQKMEQNGAVTVETDSKLTELQFKYQTICEKFKETVKKLSEVVSKSKGYEEEILQYRDNFNNKVSCSNCYGFGVYDV